MVELLKTRVLLASADSEGLEAMFCHRPRAARRLAGNPLTL
jgi:hypothetical protein